jgi:hypothetical protein
MLLKLFCSIAGFSIIMANNGNKGDDIMNRKPPTEVRRALRKEVGFGCPIDGCDKPYLEWHHFDPPWNVQEHHNVSGMIALCGEHHKKADAGTYTKEQLIRFKYESKKTSKNISGKFDWMRNKILAVVGGNFYYETPIIFQFKNKPIIWFNRDEDGYLLLNINMLTISNEPRLIIEDNFWICEGTPLDLEAPPSGRIIDVKYNNGDLLRVEFFEINSISELLNRYPDARADKWGLEYPITLVEVHEKVGGTGIDFGPKQTEMPGGCIFANGFSKNCKIGFCIN